MAYHITNICSDVPGNPVGAYPATYTSDPPLFYHGMLVYVMGSYIGMGGRSFLVAYNFTKVLEAGAKGFDGSYSSGNQLWQLFLGPPDAGDPNWDYENCNVGWVFDYPLYAKNGTMALPCSAVPDAVKKVDGGDWGVPKSIDGTVSSSWGSYLVDNRTGTMYFGTGDASPFTYFDKTLRPGLNLYGSTTVAVNLTSGRMLWWFQHNPHDLNDWDNSWAPILGTTNAKPAIFKASKDGILFSLDAATGRPNWVFDNPFVKWGPGERPLDPTNMGNMTQPWPDYPNSTWIQAPANAGALESDLAYDGRNLYGTWFNSAPNVSTVDPKTQFTNTVKTLPWTDNMSITAVDANTGKGVWNHTFTGFVFRGGMTVTNGMLIVPGGDGYLHFLSTADGHEITAVHVGPGLFVAPTIGTDVKGNVELLQVVAGGRWLAAGQVGGSATVPGALMAFELGNASRGGNGTAVTSTKVVVMSSNLPLNYVAYGAVTFAIVVTVLNWVIIGRAKNKARPS